MDWANIVLGFFALAVSGMAYGFTVWARRVDDARDSLDRMASTLREIVDLRIGSISEDVRQIKVDLHEFVKEQHNHAIEITKLQERSRDE